MNKIKMLKREIKRLLGKKSPAQLPKGKRASYVKLNDRLRYYTVGKFANYGSKPKKSNHKNVGLWVASQAADGTKVFRNKNTKLYGVTPTEYAVFNKAVKTVKKIQSANRARA